MKGIVLGAITLVSTAAAAQPFTELATELADGRYKAMTTQQLAARMLPSAIASQVISHEFNEPLVVGGAPTAVIFHARAIPSEGSFCERKSYSVSVYARRLEPTEIDDLRLGDCPLATEAKFVHVQPPAGIREAKAALRWLSDAREAAKGTAPLPFDVQCNSDMQTDACAAGARPALAALPIEDAFIVAAPKGVEGEFDFTLNSQRKPGTTAAPVWQVRAAPATANGKRRLVMTYTMPPPF